MKLHWPMCELSDKIKFCTCAAKSTDSLRHYWILHRFNANKEEFTLGMPNFPDEELYLFDHQANKTKLATRLNEPDAFDFDADFRSKDRFEIVLNNDSFDDQRVTYYFDYSKGKWRIDNADCYFDTVNNFDEIRFGKIKNARR
ncbi:MAG: hypothetical protein EOO51_08410 [Flavobacterium sp.]|nr:MAG: hypothetical protein EOO51_08410 [Flavobacterium sp.]